MLVFGKTLKYHMRKIKYWFLRAREHDIFFCLQHFTPTVYVIIRKKRVVDPIEEMELEKCSGRTRSGMVAMHSLRLLASRER